MNTEPILCFLNKIVLLNFFFIFFHIMESKQSGAIIKGLNSEGVVTRTQTTHRAVTG